MVRSDFLVFYTLIIIFSSCARIVAPSGGAKDVTPPAIIKSLPPNYTNNFTGNEIKIKFDEYFTLNNQIDNIFFSPPLQNKPTYSINNKTLTIKWNEELLKDKTYNIIFSNAIKDYHEGNILPLYQYTFSTGESIDSMFVKGQVKNAATNAPENNVYVFLYSDFADSLPYTKIPTYLTKTNTNGTFLFSNIAEGDYAIFALKDLNSNLLFDLPDESIAFYDKKIVSHSSQDSINEKIELNMFVEADTNQKLEKPVNIKDGMCRFVYNIPFSHFQAQIFNKSDIEYFEHINSSKDTVVWYFKKQIKDSIIIELTLDNSKKDTIVLVPSIQHNVPSGTRGRTSSVHKSFYVSFANMGSLYFPLKLIFSSPVQKVDSFPVTVIERERNKIDTSTYYFSIPADTLILNYPLSIPFKEKLQYQIFIPDSMFWNYENLANDSLKCSFTLKSERDYGNLIINYKLKVNCSHVVYLLDKNSNIVKTDIINSNKSITYEHLTPGDYKIKVLEDFNSNGKWDTGNYRKKIQPEKIFYFSKNITIRANWDLEEVVEN